MADRATVSHFSFECWRGPLHRKGSALFLHRPKRATSVASAYPAASSAHQTELPKEEALGFEIYAMPELGPSLLAPVAQATPNPASVAPSTRSGGWHYLMK